MKKVKDKLGDRLLTVAAKYIDSRDDLIKELEARIAELEQFKSIAHEMYPKRMLIVDGAVEYAVEIQEALDKDNHTGGQGWPANSHKPIMVDGERYYIMYAHPLQVYAIKVSWARRQYKRDARARRIRARRLAIKLRGKKLT